MNLKKILQKIYDADRRFGMLQDGDRILLGVSGGPDSMLLLTVFEKMRRSKGYRLGVAHVQYGINPAFSKAAFQTVQKECCRLGIPFYGKKLNLARDKASALSEEVSREIRYRFFEQICSRYGYQKIATAHTMDDQAETVLMRLFRGAGLRGVAGISPRYEGRSYPLIRPLLFVRRGEVMRAVGTGNIPYHVDPTNNQPRYLRNRIRNRLLPWVRRQVNPQAVEAVVDFQCASSDAVAYLGAQADRYLRHLRKRGYLKSNRWLLPLKDLRRMHAALRQVVLEKTLLAVLGVSRIPRRLRLQLDEKISGTGAKGRQVLKEGGFVELSERALVLSRSRKRNRLD